MAERFSTFVAGCASGTDKTLINIFNAVAAPTARLAVCDIVVASSATPADQACRFKVGRTTAVQVEGAGFVPVNVDPGGPAGECDSGNAHTTEPTYTANKELLVFALNQRATFRWVASPGYELRGTATQNNGVAIKSSTSTSTQAHDCTILFDE